ncbi:uncharacterized protein LOC128991001 [Macrosteles quadrilineatus]|uniref:uncharacterized protein LOC128990179 n=1 Tax=Macrosteles quadrilineatus TaxID=74068 RepID=UPI0023E1F3D9|nr:uncharacterized protein LOC128990179 [Macrosteles quadrilineatus]XP_054269677.1 uncharacterized protein LOC128991001 [Macrosteles quadrilineatus]
MAVRPVVVVCLCLVLTLAAITEGRYLPTRGQEDRLDRLRDLLRDLLDSDGDRDPGSSYAPDRRPFPKRDYYGYDPSHHFTMDHLMHP